MSSFTWLDYSEADRRRALDVVGHFREQEARDELGIGAVRDAFSDLLFPGISTIQTRARYFLFIPWIMRAAEGSDLGHGEMAPRVKAREISLINALVRAGERDGVIGIDARERLKRHASNVYWLGLRTWGIRLYPGSQTSYCEFIETFQPKGHKKLDWDDEFQVAALSTAAACWHPGLPPAPRDFPWTASLALREEDAEYLVDRIRISPETLRSMLAGMLTIGQVGSDAAFPWLYEARHELSDEVQSWLKHAGHFSTLVYGALGLYHLLLARALGREDLVYDFDSTLNDWAAVEMEAAMPALRAWNRDEFWTVVADGASGTITSSARGFLNSWWDLVLADPRTAVTSDAGANLIREREYRLKRTRARLSDPRARELWSGETRPYRLDYRWPVAKTIVSDILKGLGGGAGDA